MLKYKDFVKTLESYYIGLELPIFEKTAGEELQDEYERFENSVDINRAESLKKQGESYLLQHPNGPSILADEAYVTVYPTVIKIRSLGDGSRLAAFSDTKKNLSKNFDNLSNNLPNTQFEKAISFVLYLMSAKPEALSWSPKDSLKKESIALGSMNALLSKLSNQDASGVVKLILYEDPTSMVKPQLVEVDRVDKIKGVPRADFRMIDSDGKDFLYITHKDGKDAKGFQQYSGMTNDSNISNHPEVKSFVDKIQKLMPNGYEDSFPAGYAIKVEDPKLAALSIFGNDINGEFGINNCQVLMQGAMVLTPSTNFDGAYVLGSSGHFVISPQITGQDLTENDFGDYWPYLYVRRSRKDAQYGVKGARFMILSGRKDIIPRATLAFNSI